ncbi:MAG TPA: hypothetical protein VFF15_00845 [Flavobacteriaceae bacterium]|nr:hypothetical protein [Flavobacteriaceae bacterium]
MHLMRTYAKFIPYLYFLAVILYVFTLVNSTRGIIAYPILLLAVPFVWQLLKPNEKLNFILGISFVCLSSYVLLAYLFNAVHILIWSASVKNYLLFGGAYVLGNFIMALWMLRNSIKRRF